MRDTGAGTAATSPAAVAARGRGSGQQVDQRQQQATRSASSCKKVGRESESRSRSRCATQHQAEHRVKFHSNGSKNNGFSIEVSPTSKISDRKACEKSGNRMIYLDALRRVKTSDTEIRAIQKRALMHFYLSCFKETTTKNTASFSPARPASPVASSVTLPSASLSSASGARRSADEPIPAADLPPPSPHTFQTALPARVLAADSQEQAVIAEEQSSHKKEEEAGGDSQAAGEKEASVGAEEMSELKVALQRKQALLRDLQRNQAEASELMSKLKRNGLSAHESEKIRNHCSEIDTVTRLVLSLRCRLRSMEKDGNGWQVIRNNLQNNRQPKNSDNKKSGDQGLALPAPSSPDSSAANKEHDVLTHKRNKLLIQLEEAMSLKDMIAKRSASIRDNILSKYLGLESEANRGIDYIGLMYAKSEMMTEISDLSEHINSLQQPSVTTDLT